MFTDVTTLPPKQNIRNNCDSYLSGTAVHSVAETYKKSSLCKHVMLIWVHLTLTHGTMETISTSSEYRKYSCYIITQLDSLIISFYIQQYIYIYTLLILYIFKYP